jgi:hypothetical protein
MMEAVRTSETSVDNHFTRQYNPEDSSEHYGIFLCVTEETNAVKSHGKDLSERRFGTVLFIVRLVGGGSSI